MTLISKRGLLAALGVAIVVSGLLMLSAGLPTATIGQETDSPDIEDPGAQPPASEPDGDTDDDADDDSAGAADESAEPPASLPDSGSGPTSGGGPSGTLLMVLLGGLGVTFAGAGLMAVRRPSH